MASCPLSSVIAMERSLRQKQSPTRLGDGFAALAMTVTSLGDSVTAFAMLGNGKEMASCTPTISHCDGAFFATEAISNPSRRWLRCARHDRQRWRDGVAALAMTGTSGEMASLRSPCQATVRRWLHAPLPSVIAMERSLRQKQSPTRLGDGVAAVAMTGTGQERLHQRAIKVIS